MESSTTIHLDPSTSTSNTSTNNTSTSATNESSANKIEVKTKENLEVQGEPRKSHDEKSQPDSEGSYDLVGGVSGVTSQGASSPKEGAKGVGEDSEEEDWE